METAPASVRDPPTYTFDHEPRPIQVKHLQDVSGNFPRTAKWCPDGSCALAQCENGSFTFLTLQPEYLETAVCHTQSPDIPPALSLAQPAPILDFAWYPYAMCTDPASYCFVASIRESPVKLLDATDGRLRASYSIVDHRERQIAPHSVAFNLTSEHLYCGFDSAIERFPLHRPGEGLRLRTTPSRKSKDGLKGIISSLAFSSSYPVYAAGSFRPSSSNVALFDETAGETPIMFVGNASGVRAGVTQLHFNPLKPHYLYASFRRHSSIYSWDLRGSVDMPVLTFDRALPGGTCDPEGNNSSERPPAIAVRTDQKLRFDVDSWGRWLSVGDQVGQMSIFDLSESDLQTSPSEPSACVSPTRKFFAHDDAIGSVGFNPRYPLLLSTSGSRHFGESEEEASSSDSDDFSTNGGIKIGTSPVPYAREASIKVWECRKMI